jgi:hypothetical protein
MTFLLLARYAISESGGSMITTGRKGLAKEFGTCRSLANESARRLFYSTHPKERSIPV